MWKKDPNELDEHQSLLGDLESIKNLLNEDDDLDNNAPAAEKIPILLDTVTEKIPVLRGTANLHHSQSSYDLSEYFEPSTPFAHKHTIDEQPLPQIKKTQKSPLTNSDAEQLIENLVDEYLPIIEARLREQLKIRLEWLTIQPPSKNR